MLWNQGSMHLEGDMHHVDMQFAFSMIHINVISLLTVCAFFPINQQLSDKCGAGSSNFSVILVTEFLIDMCVQKYIAGFRDLLESYCQSYYSNIMYWHQHITYLCTSFSFY